MKQKLTGMGRIGCTLKKKKLESWHQSHITVYLLKNRLLVQNMILITSRKTIQLDYLVKTSEEFRSLQGDQ